LKAGFENGLVSTSRFHTDGYRQHSSADREQLNAKYAVARWARPRS
jgi:hypothetical protein